MQAARDSVRNGNLKGGNIYSLYDVIQDAVYKAVKRQILMIGGQDHA